MTLLLQDGSFLQLLKIDKMTFALRDVRASAAAQEIQLHGLVLLPAIKLFS